MRASHPLLILFAGFAVAVAMKSPGADVGQAPDAASGKVSLTWNNPAPRTAPLTGRLIDLTGAGIAGVEVEDTLGGGAATTRADGSFELEVAAERRVRLAVQRSGRPALYDIVQGAAGVTLLVRPDRPWITRVEPAAADLRGGAGVVHDGAGKVSHRVCVTVCETGETVSIDGAGNYRIPVPNSSFRLLAYDFQGRVALSEECPAPRAEQRWVELPPLTLESGLAARGVLRDHQGRPVKGAAIEVEGYGATRRFVTDEHGAFVATGLASGAYVVHALPTAGQAGCSEEFVLGAGAPVDVELTLRPERPLELTVVDAQGAAQAGVFVQVTEVGNTWSLGTTSNTGKVLVRGLGGGEYQFEVYASARQAHRALEVIRFDPKEALLVVR